jgi:hypothetical protein
VTESIKPANDAQAAYKEKALKVPAAYVARLAAFLASEAAAGINGQLFGVRGREIFVFSQPRPREHIVQAPDAFDPALMKQLEPGFADLVTDLEAFAGDPIL